MASGVEVREKLAKGRWTRRGDQDESSAAILVIVALMVGSQSRFKHKIWIFMQIVSAFAKWRLDGLTGSGGASRVSRDGSWGAALPPGGIAVVASKKLRRSQLKSMGGSEGRWESAVCCSRAALGGRQMVLKSGSPLWMSSRTPFTVETRGKEYDQWGPQNRQCIVRHNCHKSEN